MCLKHNFFAESTSGFFPGSFHFQRNIHSKSQEADDDLVRCVGLGIHATLKAFGLPEKPMAESSPWI